jgi:uncharacterized membrane protein (UPF0127 family)
VETIRVDSGEWSIEASYATSFRQRLAGVRRIGNRSLLMRGASAHTFGFRGPIDIVGIDDHMRVTATLHLPPNRIAIVPGARMILELAADTPVPRHGDLLTFTHV